MTATFTVRNFKIRSASQRRYVVVIVQPRDRTFVTQRWTGDGFADETVVVPAGARVHKRSDSIATARAHAARYGFPTGGGYAVVVDTATGAEV